VPFSVTFEEPRRFIMRQTGVIPAAESRAALHEIATHPRFGPGTTVLCIVEDVTDVPASDELAGLAAALQGLTQQGLVGFVVVAEPGYVYGVARMFSAASEMLGVRVEVTDNETEARNILDIAERTAPRKR
jgi:hypothetical protein